MTAGRFAALAPSSHYECRPMPIPPAFASRFIPQTPGAALQTQEV